MRFSLELPTTRVDRADQFVTAAAVTEITRSAAGAGFDAVNVTDHPAPDARWLDRGGHHALDPMVALAVAAAADPAILVHTNVYVPAYRNPFLAAKQVLSLDQLSDGRLVLGVAAGYLRPEFAALGVDFERRGALLDDALDVLTTVCSGEDVERSTAAYAARGVRIRPLRPGGRPPVWVGGNSRVARRRASRFEGWAPFHTSGYARASRTAALESVDDLRSAIAEVRSLASRHGAERFDVCWSDASLGHPGLSDDERRARIGALGDAGVSWLVVQVHGDDRAEVVDGIGAFGRGVIAELGEEVPWRSTSSA